jgi:hypothetical protein
MRGLALPDLAAEVKRQAESKRDFIVPASRVKFVSHENDDGPVSLTRLAMQGHEENLDIRGIFHGQVGDHLKIPRAYYNRMLTNAPVLLRRNVNHWLAQDQSTRLVRILDGNARAFLSDRYRVLDNYDLCEAILPLFAEHKLEVVSADVTDKRMYLKAVHPGLKAELRHVGGIVQGGVSVWNSETGHGTCGAESFIYTLTCLNGMTMPASGMRKFHLGRQHSRDEDKAMEVFRDETRAADDKAFFMKLQDITNACLKTEKFQELIGKINRASGDDELKSTKGRPLDEAVEVTRKAFSLTEDEGSSILKHLIEGGDLSRWGMASAVTRAAQDQENYDRFDALERVGGEIIELPKKRWADLVCLN